MKPPIEEVLTHYGAEIHVTRRHGWQKIKCPFHDDSEASASINVETDQFRCFACGIESPIGESRSNTLDSFDIIAWKEGVSDFPSAKRRAEEIFGERYGDLLSEPQGQSRRRVFGESRPKRGQRSAFSAGVRRRAFNRA